MELVPDNQGRPLPVKWDDHKVTWDEFKIEPATTLEFHVTKAERLRWCCTKCGTPDREATHAVGTVHPLEGEMTEGTVRRRSKRTGNWLNVPTMVPAWPLRVLHASRCGGCGLDTVWDMRTDEWWELDESDYGPDGSQDELTLF